MVEENGMESFPNDLKVDLGACCTKGKDQPGATSRNPQSLTSPRGPSGVAKRGPLEAAKPRRLSRGG